MSVITSTLGPNSAYVAYTPGETAATVHAGVISWLQQHGWELFDPAASASSVAFRSVCKDGTTYKYLVVGYAVNGITFRVFETWNSSTHVGTNETQYGGTATALLQRVDVTNGGYIYLYATNRYAIAFARTNSGTWGDTINSTWSGVFEFSEDARDTRGFPPFGFTSGLALNGGLITAKWGAGTSTQAGALTNWAAANPVVYSAFSLPRTTTGLTGAAAERYTNVGGAVGMSQINVTTVMTQFAQSNGTVYSTYGHASPAVSYGYYTNIHMIDESGASIPTNTNSYAAGGTSWTTYGSGNTVNALHSTLPSTNNGMTNTPWAITPWVYEMGATTASLHTVSETRGKIFGIKLLQQSLGVFMDTVSISVDDDGAMDINGTSLVHHVITGGTTTSRFAVLA